jgi:hypothetical protein
MEKKNGKKMYKVRCTNGSVEEYGYKDIFDIVKSYLEKRGQYPTAADVDNYIPTFLGHMKKFVRDDYTREYDEARDKAAAVAE